MGTPNANEIARILSEQGLRMTRQRRAVLDVVLECPTTLSPMQVFDAARRRCPELGLTTVYRTLDVLSEVGALRRVHGADHCEGFTTASATHGHTVVCESCGRAAEFTDCDLRDIAAAASRQTGFVISDHFLQLTGLCPNCAGDAQSRTRRSGTSHR